MKEVWQRHRVAIVGILLAVVTVLLYLPMRNHGFVDYDDPDYVLNNVQIKKGVTGEGIIWALTRSHSSNWHPLTWISHMLDWQMFGDKAGGHHMVNLLFHTLNTVLLLLVLRKLTGSLWRSAFVAALFAWHPLHVESVAWVSERKDVLSGFFWILTIWAYGHYVEKRSWQRYTLTLVFFALGLMSKPMVVTLPCVLLLLDWWPLRRWDWPGKADDAAAPRKTESLGFLLVEKIPFIALTIGSSLATFWAQKAGGAVASVSIIPLENRIANAFISYQRYLEMMFLPRNLAVIYPHPQGDWTWWRLTIAILLLVAVLAVGVWLARRKGYLITGWLWYLGSLVPMIGLVQVGSQALADRYTYIPLIGVFVMIVWGLAELVNRWPQLKEGLAITGGLALVACLTLTSMQLRVWKDSYALFGHAAKVVPRNFIAHRNLGDFYVGRGDYDVGFGHFKKALEYLPKYTEVHNNWGVALFKQNKHAESVPHFLKALEIKKDNTEARINLANALTLLGKTDEAIGHYQEVLKVKPQFADAHNNLGNAYVFKQRYDEAIACYTEALRLKPEYAEAHTGLGLALSKKGRADEALTSYRESLRLNPNLMEAHHNLALSLAGKGLLDEAMLHYAEAVRLKPDNAEVRLNYGNAFVKKNQFAEAAAQFEVFIKLQPNHPEARASYAFALAKMSPPRLTESAAEYSKALALNPNQMEAHNNLGWVLSTMGKQAEAIEHYRAAIKIKPEAVEAHFNLGLLLTKQNQLSNALAEFQEVLRLNPNHAGAHNEVGNVLLNLVKFPEAAESYRAAIKLVPNDHVPRNQLAFALVGQRKAAEALPEFREALRLKPDSLPSLNALAWILSTHEDDKLRNGAEAVQLATRAVNLTASSPNPRLLGTLAAAQAETGQFDDAIATAQKALELAKAAKQADTVAQLEERLKVFQSRKPFRDPSFSPPKPRVTITPIEPVKKK